MSSIDTRHLERDSLFLMADLSVSGTGGSEGTSERVKVRNLSSGGMMAVSGLAVKRGTRVVVELRNIGSVAGVVVWVRGPRIGIAFETEIDAKLARTQVYGGDSEAPAYARAAVAAPSHDGWNGKLRRV